MPLTFDESPGYSGIVFDVPSSLAVLTFDELPGYSLPDSTAPTGTLAPPAGISYIGEALIRDTIRQIAVSTTAFERCWVGSRLDYMSQPTSTTAFSVQAKGTREIQGWDAAPMWTRAFQSTFRLAIYVHDTNPEQRDAIATNLLSLMADRLDGKSIAGLTMPDRTKITDWNWHGDQAPTTSMAPVHPDVPPPSRELEATFVCDWIEGPS